MKELKEYTIPFVGLKQGEHRFDFEKPNCGGFEVGTLKFWYELVVG